MWILLLKRYWNVCLFRQAPENTPYSFLLAFLVSLLFFCLIIFQWYLSDTQQTFSLLTSIFMGLALLSSYVIYTYFLLKFYQKINRFLQTLTALYACHFVIHIIAMPLLLLAPVFSSDLNRSILLLLGIIYLLLTLLLATWQFLVTAHIYKHALDEDNLRAMLASLGLLACNVLTLSFW